jgi:hypothetical protein
MCEALVLAALHSVFSSKDGWTIEPQWYYPDDTLPLHDVFDFMIYRAEKSEIVDAMAIQVTSYKEGRNVKEEPNKTYEFFETLEEFTYFLSRARTTGLPKLPIITKFGHVLFGNKRYVRKWVLTHQESVFDLCVYPHYDHEENYSSEPLYPKLREVAKGNTDLYEVAREIIRLDKEEVLDDVVATQLERTIRRFREYEEAGFPLNSGGQLVLNARRECLRSKEYQENRDFLMLQLKDGPPAKRLSIKHEFLQPSIRPTAEWRQALEQVRTVLGKKRPEFAFGKNLLANYGSFARDFSKSLVEKKEDCIAAFWNSPDLGCRRFMRMTLVQFSGMQADDLFSDVITEQNLSSQIFGKAATKEVVSKLTSGIKTKTGTLNDRKRIHDYVESMKSRIEDMLSYIERNGTTNRPVTEFLQYLVGQAVANGQIPATSQIDEGFSSYLVDYVYDAKDRLRTFPEHAVHGLGHSCTFHSEMTFRKKDGALIFVKSKYTDSEERRRTKEEGQKAWLGKLHYDHDGKPPLTVDDSKEFWILLDGNWNRVLVMEQLVECGWRVYFDAFTLVKELSDTLR